MMHDPNFRPDRPLPPAFFAALVNSLSEAIVVMDDRSVIRYFSPGASQMFGYGVDDMVGRKIENLMPAAIATNHRDYVQRYLESGYPHILDRTREVTGLTKDGRMLPLDLRVVRLRVNGSAYFAGTLRDVSERKSREAALAALGDELAERNSRLDAALANIEEGVCLYDASFNLITFNRRYLELFGLPNGVVRAGMSIYAMLDLKIGLGAIPGYDAVTLAERRTALAKGGKPGVLTLTLKNGRILRISHRPLAEGRSIATYSDITEHEHAAESLREACQRAEQANKAKSGFLANMSHELRTPLNAIIGLSEALSLGYRGPLNDPQQEYLRDIHAAGTHLLGIINELLDVAKIEAGKFQLHEETITLRQLLDQALQVVGSLARTAGLKLSQRAYPDDGRRPAGVESGETDDGGGKAADDNGRKAAASIRFRGDPRALSQALINLLSNAVKFTPRDGSIELGWCINAEGGLQIRIADTGIGMRPSDIATALTPFGQIDNVYSRHRHGTGLGLPLAKYLVELHGGHLGIDSEFGHGTTIIIDLPGDRLVSGEPQSRRKEAQNARSA